MRDTCYQKVLTIFLCIISIIFKIITISIFIIITKMVQI